MSTSLGLGDVYKRQKEAVYIYVQKNQAYLLNESMDAAWSLLGSTLPAASLHDCRK